MKQIISNAIKIISLNVFVFLALFSLILLTIPLAHTFYRSISTKNGLNSSIANLPVYNNYDWAGTFYKELSSLDTEYHDYIGWRRKDFKGTTIQIIDGMRYTPQDERMAYSGDPVFFFGGSTTWGTGVNNHYTYPAVYSRMAKRKALNFGESGYVARQSLAYLQNIYITESFNFRKTIVFYDGVNDVGVHCRVENDGIGSSREQQVRRFIKTAQHHTKDVYSYRQILRPFWGIAKQLRQVIGLNVITYQPYRHFLCDSDTKRAHIVARQLVETWRLASQTAKSNGDDFVAILQPVAFIGSPKLNYLRLDDEHSQKYSKQYQAVYPLIKKYAATAEIQYYDFSGVYDGCEYCYVDRAHVGPQAHGLLATRLAEILNER